MRRGMWIGALVVAMLSAGAVAEQVTRAEFRALADKVGKLEARCTMLEIGIKALREEKARAAVAPLPAQPPVVQAPGEPLEGADLVAWKLARAGAEDFQRKSSRAGHWTGSGARRVGTGVWIRGYTPPKLQVGEPTTACMGRTRTGDYIFRFRRVSEKGSVDYLKITVVDYGTELRVEKTQIER